MRNSATQPISFLDMVKGNLHLKDQYRKEEQRLLKGSTLENCIRRSLLRKVFQTEDSTEEEVKGVVQHTKSQLQKRRLQKIAHSRNNAKQKLKICREVDQSRKSLPLVRWKSPFLASTSALNPVALHNEAVRQEQARKQLDEASRQKANESQALNKKVYLNQHFSGFGEYFSVKTEEQSWQKRSIGAVCPQKPMKSVGVQNNIHSIIISEFNQIVRRVKFEQQGSALLHLKGKYVQNLGSPVIVYKPLPLNEYFFLPSNREYIRHFSEVCQFYREHIRRDSFELVEKFFNGITHHRQFNLQSYMNFYRLFVLRTATLEAKQRFVLHFLISPKFKIIEISSLRLVFELLSSRLPGQDRRESRGKFIEEMLMKIMVGNLSRDPEKEFSIVDEEVMRSIISRNSEAVDLIITLFYTGPIA